MQFRDLSRWGQCVLIPLFLMGAACSGPASSPASTTSSDGSFEAPAGGGVPDVRSIVVLGDSLTAGLGLLLEQSYPNRLQEMFIAEGYHDVDVMNSGVSGDTTAGGLRRIGGLLHPGVRIVVVALGGNDALRGLSIEQTRQNLLGIVDASLQSGAAVLLAGMEGPTNLGEDYRTNFRNIYQEIAAQYRGRIRFVPFLLEGVAGMPQLNQPDGIHPTAEGASMVAEHLYPTLRDMVDEIPAGPVTK